MPVAGDDLHENLTADFPGATEADCDGHGWIHVRFPEGHEHHPGGNVRCHRCTRAKVHSALAEFVPPRFRDLVDVPEPVLAWARRGTKAEGLYLAGQVGTGKTHAAWVAVSAWCLRASVIPSGEDFWEDGYSGRRKRYQPTVIFARLTDLLDDFRPGDDSVQRVRDCQAAGLLVIDDIGAEKPSEWTQERLYSVIDHRYVNCMPLIVTGNLPPKQLAEQTGDRVVSRLAEMCTVVPMTGSDRRRAA
jgi:DNA replication protein DnaC